MKKIAILLLLFGFTVKGECQSQEAKQLLLDVEKFSQFKQILSDMKKGYDIVSKGYNTIKNISQGTFDLHKAFLDGLLEVSPLVKKYKKVADIVSMQIQLVKEYKSAFKKFQGSKLFYVKEIDYISKVYSNLFNASLKNIDALVTVITANQLRMTDDERLNRIDDIYNEMQDKLVFLRHFNTNTSILALQKGKEGNDVTVMRKLYDIK
jgi:hypothetical protein